ncbi:MAG: DUF3617 family protein [Desulfatibacillum sp.]|nr:DUF3617 family protein [Desulfatibacillum sp.]
MNRIFTVMMILLFMAATAQAGWFDDTLKGALQNAGERGIEEAVDASYEGGKNVGKEAIQEAGEEEPEDPAPQAGKSASASTQGAIEELDLDSINMKEGQWKITMIMQAAGMKLPPQVYTTCLTKENIVPQNDEEADDCQTTSLRAVGDTVYWTMECKDEGSTTHSQGQITYHGKSFEGTVTVSIRTQEGGTMTMNNTMQGKYMGACTGQEE